MDHAVLSPATRHTEILEVADTENPDLPICAFRTSAGTYALSLSRANFLGLFFPRRQVAIGLRHYLPIWTLARELVLLFYFLLKNEN